MLDASIRKVTENLLRKLPKAQNGIAIKNELIAINEILSESPYLKKLADLGIDLAKDRNQIKYQTILSYLAKIFGLYLAPPTSGQKPDLFLDKKVTNFLDRLMKVEVAEILEENKLLRKNLQNNKSPILLAARSIQSSVAKASSSKIEIPVKVLQQLDLDPRILQNLRSHSNAEIFTLLQKNFSKSSNKEEIKELSLPTLWNLNTVYLENSKRFKIKSQCIDRLKEILFNIKLEQNPKVLDHAALVYYCVKHSQEAIKGDTALDDESKELLLQLTNTVIANIVRQLKESPWTDFTFNTAEKALKGLQNKVISFSDDEFQEMSLKDFVWNLRNFVSAQEKQIDFQDQLFNERLIKVKEAIHEQWEKEPDFKFQAQEVLRNRMKSAKLTVVLPNPGTALKELEAVLDSLAGDSPKLLLTNKGAGDAFIGLTKYTSHIQDHCSSNTVDVLKNFFQDEVNDDLFQYLKLEEEDVIEDAWFAHMREVANKLKVLNKSVGIQFTSSLIDKSKLTGNIIYFGGYLNIKESDLILNFIHMNRDKVERLKARQSVDFNTGIAVAVQALLNKSAVNSSMVINDLNDKDLIASVKDIDFIQPIDNILSQASGNKLLITICDDNDSVRNKPLYFMPANKTPNPAPVLPV